MKKKMITAGLRDSEEVSLATEQGLIQSSRK